MTSRIQVRIRRQVTIAISLLLWLAALALVVGTGTARLPAPSWGNAVGVDLTAEIAGKAQVGQVFVAPLPGLSSVQVVLAGGRADTPAGGRQGIFHLAIVDDSPATGEGGPIAASDLLSKSFGLSALPGDVSCRFDFPPVRASQQQAFYFYLEAPASLPGDGIAARYGPDTAHDGALGGATLNRELLPGNLRFRTGYTLTVGERLDVVLARMAQGRPQLLGIKGFYVGLAAAYALGVGVLVLRVAGSIVDAGKGEHGQHSV